MRPVGDDGTDLTADAARDAARAAALAYFHADYTAARAQLEAAFRGFRDGGEPALAARMAMELAEMHASVYGNASAAAGWIARGRRLLEPLGDVVELGYLELAIMACDRLDMTDLAASADRALEIARRFGDVDLEARALADGGLALVCQGRLSEGFALLDEALVTVTGGDCRGLDTAPRCLCSLLASCDRAGDLRRADEWTRLVSGTVEAGSAPTVLAEHCRIVQSAILGATGRWAEAEASLQSLLDAMSSSAPHRVETLARLAELRLAHGRLDEAAALIGPYLDSITMRAPMARLHLARGEAAEAVAVAEIGLRDLVADRLRGAPLLDIVVQAHVQLGDADAAAAAAARLSQLAAETESVAVAADAAGAQARVAALRGDHAAAGELFATAVRGYEATARPLHAGTARLELAAVVAAAGESTVAVAEARAALAQFERLGATPMVDRTLQLLRELGARARGRTDVTAAVASLTARESEVLDLVRQGLTNAEIGRRLFISAKTAEHHVGRLLTKLGVRTRAEAAALAATARATAGEPARSADG